MTPSDVLQPTDRNVAAATIQVVGFPGAFAEWGLLWVRQILEHAGLSPQIVKLREAGPGLRIGFGHAPRLPRAPARTVVFLDTLPAAMGGLLLLRTEPAEVVRDLADTLAPLAAILREPDALLIQRGPMLDLDATRHAIARHLLPDSAPPPTLACERAFDLASPQPQLTGQALALTRQVLEPMLAHAIGRESPPIVWPLNCFYSGDRPGEQAVPVIETAGFARVLYYGPYFKLPPGRWRVDVQLFFFNDVPASLIAAEMLGRTQLARIECRPVHCGLFQASMPIEVDMAEERLELRICLVNGTISGMLGLHQVVIVPVAETAAPDV
jgi:hypothetical protein